MGSKHKIFTILFWIYFFIWFASAMTYLIVSSRFHDLTQAAAEFFKGASIAFLVYILVITCWMAHDA